jgi:carboxyl-terminal processing protease
MSKQRHRLLFGLALVLAGMGLHAGDDDRRAATFDFVWETVRETHYDPDLGGVDWVAARERHRPAALAAESVGELRAVLGALLGELGQSHFGIVPREGAVFDEEARSGTGTSGAHVALVEGAVTLARIAPDSPADRGGLKPGQVIMTVDGLDLGALGERLADSGLPSAMQSYLLVSRAQNRLGGEPGAEIAVTTRDPAGQETTTQLRLEPYTGRWSEPLGMFPAMPVEFEAHTLADGWAYLRFTVWVPAVMEDLRQAVRAAAERAAPGLIIDLRGNPGGLGIMAGGLTGLLVTERVTLGSMRLRSGHLNIVGFPQAGAYLGPVAVLVDATSASTSEIFAAGLQEAGRARVFGETTAGAVLPSQFRAMPNGDLLQMAFADFRTPVGTLLEGRGCPPDEPIAPTAAQWYAGDDPVLAAALRWLSTPAE